MFKPEKNIPEVLLLRWVKPSHYFALSVLYLLLSLMRVCNKWGTKPLSTQQEKELENSSPTWESRNNKYDAHKDRRKEGMGVFPVTLVFCNGVTKVISLLRSAEFCVMSTEWWDVLFTELVRQWDKRERNKCPLLKADTLKTDSFLGMETEPWNYCQMKISPMFYNLNS